MASFLGTSMLNIINDAPHHRYETLALKSPVLECYDIKETVR